MKLKTWLDSGANSFSCRKQTFTFEELGLTEDEWDEMTEYEKEEFVKEIVWNWMDWGFRKINNEGEPV